MQWPDRTAMLGLILSLSLGLCTLFLVASDFFGPFFEFLGLFTFVLGWFIVAPAYYFLTRPTATEAEMERGRDTDSDSTPPTDPMETLRRRYAAGELSETEFERKLERLLETEGQSVGDSVSTPTSTPSSVDDYGQDELDRELEREYGSE